MAEVTLNPEEISEALRRNLEGWSPSVEAETIGYVTSVGDGVARVSGLPERDGLGAAGVHGWPARGGPQPG